MYSLHLHHVCPRRSRGPVRAKMAAHGSDLREQVVETLRDNNGPMETLAIAHSVGLRTRKQINRALYKMQQQGTILKVSESPPKWGLKHEVTLGHESQVKGPSPPLHPSAAEEHDPGHSSEEMPSLEYISDGGTNDVAAVDGRSPDGSYDGQADEGPPRGRMDRYDYPQNERMVQYKDSPLPSARDPLRYGEAPAAVSAPGDSVAQMEVTQEMRGHSGDSHCTPGCGDPQDSPAPCSLSTADDSETLDQPDSARNGLPNVPTVAEAVEFLKPSVAPPENRSSLSHRLLATLCTMSESVHSNDLAKLVGLRSKKDINPTLFGMQKQALVRKVSESPPLWVVTPYGRQAVQSGDQSNHQAHAQQQRYPKCPGGPPEAPPSTPRSQFPSQYVQQQWPQYPPAQRRSPRSQGPAKSDGQAWPFSGPPPPPAMLLQAPGGQFQGNQRPEANHPGNPYIGGEWTNANQDTRQQEPPASNWSIPPLPPNSSIPPLPPNNGNEFEPYQDQLPGQPSAHEGKNGSQSVNGEQARQVLQALSSGEPFETLEIAKAIGCKATRDVNPTIYAMYRGKLLDRVKEAPPVWRLSPAGKEEARNGISTDASPGVLPPTPQELMQRTSGWRAGAGSSAGPQTCAQSSYSSNDSQAVLPSHGAAGQSQNPAGSAPNSAGATMSSEMFGAINKNPISALTEYAQSRHLPVAIDMVNQQGPPHNPRFTFCARVGNRSFPQITSRSKKDGRREAADVALRSLIAEGNYQVKMNTSSLETTPSNGTTFYDRIAGLSHQAFNSIAAGIPDNISGRKVLAALIMKRGEGDEGTVISLGTGNRCVTGDMLSLEGGTVNDSHAEIITRRAFLRYLYNQLAEFKQRPNNTILDEAGAAGRFRVRPGVTFHLYISTAPCGDGAQFSRTDAGENAEGPEGLEFTGRAQHLPTFGKSIQGLLRTKMEYGEGTIPVDSSHPVQTWDGIIRGERLRTMSCSDKVARWNILGLQGALLSHFLEPIYLNSLTLGSLYHHGHLSRAVCCRLGHAVDAQDPAAALPAPYSVHHPQLGCVTAFDPPRGTEKTKALSINWFLECGGPEVTDGTKGRVQGVVPSQLCKSALFAEFRRVARLHGRDDLLQARTYHEAKGSAGEFEAAKAYMKEAFRKGGYRVWIEKPVEEELFSL